MDGRPRSSATVLSQAVRTIGASAGGAAPPNILLSRPLDQAGRKSETTLGIAGLHFKIGAFHGAAPDQFKLPPGAATPGTGKGVAGRTVTRQRVTDAVGWPKS